LAVAVSAIIGIARSNDNAQSVFWAMVQNSMITNALTVETKTASSGTSEDVLSQLDFGQHPVTRTLTTLESDGSTAQAETLTTPKSEYTRYDSIHKTIKGKPVNFKNVIGLWAKTASYGGGTIPPTFAQVLLDQLLPLPMGNLTNSERVALTQQIKDGQVYTIDFSSARKITYQGRAAYAYTVSIQPVLYLQLIKNYAPDIDMHQLDQLNPNAYGGETAVSATWTVDAKAKELVKADYGDGRVQTYGGWGVPITTQVPTHTITAAALQRRLNAAL
jgi:hypothetical protein